MFCENCGKKLEEGSAFCNVCGAKQPQPVFCIQCGKKLEPRSRFCNGCGASQVSEEPQVTAPQKEEIPEPAEPVIPEAPEPVFLQWSEMPEPVCEEPAEEAIPEEIPEQAPAAEKPAKKKKSKKWLIPVIALAAAVAVAAVLLIPVLFPKPEETVTIYLLTGRTEWVDGVQTSQTVVEYDDLGRPTRFSLKAFQEMECTVEYDRFGNRSEEVFSRIITFDDAQGETSQQKYSNPRYYDYKYDEDGQIRKCTLYRLVDGQKQKEVTLEFTYDDGGRVILVEYDFGQDKVPMGQVWDQYEYDRQGRLVQETFCSFWDLSTNPGPEQGDGYSSNLTRYTYSYDGNGNLDSLCRSGASVIDDEVVEYDELEDVEFAVYEEFSVAVRNGYIIIEGDEDVLDENGNPSTTGDVFDEHGNLIRTEGTYKKEENGVQVEHRKVTEYTYEALELPKSAALRAQRLTGMCCLPRDIYSYAYYFFGEAILDFRTRPILMHEVRPYTSVYYYLIPNPVC